ncbi:MAG: dephospho-CoA kinase [Burkholderiales bacterium]
MPFCVGLTGGIGSGKSSAARLFQALGAGIVDVDEISHALTKPGGAGIPGIISQFGRETIAADGSLDRARMRDLVFNDAQAKSRLEAVLHPLIGQKAKDQVAHASEPYVLLVVPLLLERNAYKDLVQRIAVVDCSEQTQIERTMRRSQLSEATVRAIMAAQISRADRLVNADDVLNNDGGESSLQKQVAALHERYLELAQKDRHRGR